VLITPVTPPTITASLLWLAVLAAVFAVLWAWARTRAAQRAGTAARGAITAPNPDVDLERDVDAARCEADQPPKAA
jgi:hypothetical protein